MSIGSPAGESRRLLLGALTTVRASWPSHGWSWDGRFSCVTSSFNVEFEEKALAAAAIALTSRWTPASLDEAPLAVREIATSTGGLRAGQMIFASAEAAVFAYGLWWPWGDGATMSFRIGLGGQASTPDALQSLRNVFDVEV
jgi:hypothetical protein